MRRRAALVVAAAAVAATGCGSSSKTEPAGLAWVGTPVAYQPKGLPTDRVLLSKVRNAGGKPLSLVAAKLVVRDASGKVLNSSARFIAGYGHGLYGAFQKPNPLPPQEISRMGIAVTLPPGKTAPISVAWRLAPGSKGPATVDYGAGTLTLPAKALPGD